METRDFISELTQHEQDFSGALGDVAKMQGVLERPDKLANTGVVTKPEAVRAVAGMPSVLEKPRQLLK